MRGSSSARWTRREAARAAGLKGAVPGGAEALYLHLAANKPPREQFASREDRRRYVVWQLQRGIVAAGAVGFAGAARLSRARKWLDALQARERRPTMQAQRGAPRRRASTERITAAFPVTQTTTDNLRATVVEFRRIAAHIASPGAAFAHVSRVLEQFPQIEIDSLEFSVGQLDARERRDVAPEPAAPGQSRTAARRACGWRSRAGSTRRSATTTAASPPRCAASPTRSAPAGYQLARTELPFDITSEGTLTGDIGGRPTRARRRASPSCWCGSCHELHPRRAEEARAAGADRARAASPPASALMLARATRAAGRKRKRLAAAQAERRQNAERLARIAEEEREVKEKLDVYQQLKAAQHPRRGAPPGMGRRHHAHPRPARAARPALPRRAPAAAELRCRASRPTSTSTPAPCACELALLHEEDLLRFLADLRASGNAYYAVQAMRRSTRTGTAADRQPTSRRACAAECDHRPHHHHRPGGQVMRDASLCSPFSLACSGLCWRRSSAACSSRPSSARRSTRGAGRACRTGRRSRWWPRPRLGSTATCTAPAAARRSGSTASRSASTGPKRAAHRARSQRAIARVSVPAGEGSARFSLKPGQVLDRGTGEVRDVLGAGRRAAREARQVRRQAGVRAHGHARGHGPRRHVCPSSTGSAPQTRTTRGAARPQRARCCTRQSRH